MGMPVEGYCLLEHIAVLRFLYSINTVIYKILLMLIAMMLITGAQNVDSVSEFL